MIDIPLGFVASQGQTLSHILVRRHYHGCGGHQTSRTTNPCAHFQTLENPTFPMCHMPLYSNNCTILSSLCHTLVDTSVCVCVCVCTLEGKINILNILSKIEDIRIICKVPRTGGPNK
jgi:hypothetical protein